jgi:hypothetical protein
MSEEVANPVSKEPEPDVEMQEVEVNASDGSRKFKLQGAHVDDTMKKKGKAGQAGDKLKQKLGLKEQDPKMKLCIYLVSCILLWSICGMWYYHDIEGWSWSGAMFYATNVGLGVGYGVYNITTAGSKWFTIFYCLMGSSFVAGGMGLFVGFYMEQSDEKYAAKREEFLLKGQGTTEFLKDGSFSKWEKKYFYYLKHKYTYWSIIIFVGLVIAGIIFSMVAGGQLGCPTETIPNPTPDNCYPRDSVQYKANKCDNVEMWNGADPHTVSKNACWDKDCTVWSQSIAGNHCDDIAEALFFVVTSMSTASQVAPKNQPFQLWFTIIYIFIGIPIYGALLGMVADVYINRYARKQDREDLNKSAEELDADMFQRMGHLNEGHHANQRMIELGAKSGEANEDDSVPVFWGDYLEYMMRKNELVDRKLLDLIKFNYYKLDKDHKGYFNRSEVEAMFDQSPDSQIEASSDELTVNEL